MTMKECKPCQNIYVVYMKKGYNADPVILERKISKIGRKYITDDLGCRFYEWNGLFLEDREVGEKGYLFFSKKEAEAWIELDRLEIWLSSINCYNHPFTLEQLRKVKAILEPGA